MKDREIKDLLHSSFRDDEQTKLRPDGKFKAFVSGLPDISKPRFQFRIRFAFLALLLLVIPLGIILLSSNKNPDENNFLTSKNLELNYLIYSGVSKSFKGNLQKGLKSGNGAVLKNLSEDGEEAEEEYVFTYPFDYLKIEDPMSFYIQVEEGTNELIEKHCGSGEIEVVICGISFYFEDGSELIKDETLIIFRGVYGIYSCLINSVRWDYEEGQVALNTYEFSSHKFISGNAIIKDLRLKNIIRLVINRGEPISLEFGDFYTKEIKISYVPYSPKSISCSDLYSLSDLFTFGSVEIETRIMGFEEGLIKVQNVEGMNLIYGAIDENTEINKAILEIGQYIKLTYLKYYEEYNPLTTYLYKVDVLDEIDHKVFRKLSEEYSIGAIPSFTILQSELNKINELAEGKRIVDVYSAKKDGDETKVLLVFVFVGIPQVPEELPLEAVDYALSYFGISFTYDELKDTRVDENCLVYEFSETEPGQ